WDVPRDQFVDASTAWRRVRAGAFDPARMGLSVLGLTGAWFVVGNLMLDAAALNKEEMLPWEKWSGGREGGPGQEPTGAGSRPRSCACSAVDRWRSTCGEVRVRSLTNVRSVHYPTGPHGRIRRR